MSWSIMAVELSWTLIFDGRTANTYAPSIQARMRSKGAETSVVQT